MARSSDGNLLRLAAWAFVAALFAATSAAEALSLSISPTLITLQAKSASALLTIANPGDSEIRLEVAVYSWAEDENGGMSLEPTDELVVFPLLASVPARGERKIRVGLGRRDAVTTERSYRVVLEEMPPTQATEPGVTAVKMLTNFSIPVFASPAKAEAGLQLDGARLEAGRLEFRLVNPGNSHVRVKELVVTSTGSDGKELGRHELKAWYLLAGGSRLYDLRVEAEECRRASSFVIDAQSDHGNLSHKLVAGASSCESEPATP